MNMVGKGTVAKTVEGLVYVSMVGVSMSAKTVGGPKCRLNLLPAKQSRQRPRLPEYTKNVSMARKSGNAETVEVCLFVSTAD